jgi:hypothetical protein
MVGVGVGVVDCDCQLVITPRQDGGRRVWQHVCVQTITYIQRLAGVQVSQPRKRGTAEECSCRIRPRMICQFGHICNTRKCLKGVTVYDSRGLIGLGWEHGWEHVFPARCLSRRQGSEPGPLPDADVGLPRGDRQECSCVHLARIARVLAHQPSATRSVNQNCSSERVQDQLNSVQDCFLC